MLTQLLLDANATANNTPTSAVNAMVAVIIGIMPLVLGIVIVAGAFGMVVTMLNRAVHGKR